MKCILKIFFNANHRKQRGRTAPNRALRIEYIMPKKSDHRKQRGRTAPNRRKG